MLRKIEKLCLSVVIAAMLVPALAIAAHSDNGCDSCHTPHHAAAGQVPLWNGAVTTSSFTPYSSATLDATVGQPDGSSKLCLSCHDGTNADLAGIMATTRTGTFTASVELGTDLSSSHPISFVYDGSLATTDGGLKDPSADSGIGGTIAEAMLDGDSKVQCTSCHDVHSTGIGTTSLRGFDYFRGTGGGNLCKICHNK